MILVVDAGNSRIKWAFSTLDSAHPLESTNAGSAFYQPPMERAASLEATLESVWCGFPAPTRVLVSNVGGDSVRCMLRTWIKQHWRVVPEFVHSRPQGWGVVNGYDRPADLGVDRWAGMVGAFNVIKAPCCIIDGGTAVTIDGVNKQGNHIGGVIMPGITLMRRSLLENTSRIRVADSCANPGLGKNTGDAVASGTTFAVIAGIEHALAEIERVLGSIPTILVAGGDANIIGAAISRSHKIDHHLVLKGLVTMASAAP